MAQEFALLTAWLTSESADETVAPRQIIIQVAGEDEDDPKAPSGLVAIASVNGEDYIAGTPSGDNIVEALDSLSDELLSEANSLLALVPSDEEEPGADEAEDEEEDDEEDDDDE